MSTTPRDQTPAAAWQQLVTLAVLGTDRAGRELPRVDGRPGELLSRLTGRDPEQMLLCCAGILSSSLDAGRRPRRIDARQGTACEADTLPLCSPRAAGLLMQVIRDDREQLLEEWCAAAADARRRVPEPLLARFLDAVMRIEDPAAQACALRVAGQRGQWLARHNPRWSACAAAATEDPAEVWSSGTREERLRVLHALRQSDPRRARDLVVATWAHEPADVREPVVESFVVGLCMEDEPFLEAALDDKRKNVRTRAAALLAGLPESRLCRRMVERMTPLLRTAESRGGLLRRSRVSLQVVLPEGPDKAMLRDGLEAKAKGELGAKAVLLQRMLAATPLRTWTESWGMQPAEVVALAAHSEWKEAIIQGWAAAALSQRSAEWIAALFVDRQLLAIPPDRWVLPDDALGHLVACLEPVDRERVLVGLLQTRKSALTPAMVSMLVRCRHGWSETFTRVVATQVVACTKVEPTPYYLLHSLFTHAGRYMHPQATLDDLGPLLQDGASPPDFIRRFLDMLALRRDYLKELRP